MEELVQPVDGHLLAFLAMQMICYSSFVIGCIFCSAVGDEMTSLHEPHILAYFSSSRCSWMRLAWLILSFDIIDVVFYFCSYLGFSEVCCFRVFLGFLLLFFFTFRAGIGMLISKALLIWSSWRISWRFCTLCLFVLILALSTMALYESMQMKNVLFFWRSWVFQSLIYFFDFCSSYGDLCRYLVSCRLDVKLLLVLPACIEKCSLRNKLKIRLLSIKRFLLISLYISWFTS